MPHAGHIYSGPIAARAYALLVPLHAAIAGRFGHFGTPFGSRRIPVSLHAR